MTPDIRRGTRIIWIGVIVLIVLRQDLWFWNDASLVFGVLPIGLAWQVAISIGAAILWLAATKIAWPADESYPEITVPNTPGRSPSATSPANIIKDETTEASR